jgi:hypothetical protein
VNTSPTVIARKMATRYHNAFSTTVSTDDIERLPIALMIPASE